MIHLLEILLLLSCSFLAGVSGHSRDVAQRRGFTPQAIEAMQARNLLGRDTTAAEPRYYTNDTKSKEGDNELVNTWLIKSRILCRVVA